MDLKLSDSELALLRRWLPERLSELREEIVKTEKYELRQQLHGDEDLARGLIERLGAE